MKQTIIKAMLANRVQFILQQECGLGKGSAILVGVSGGPDSLCLLDILVQLGYLVSVAHVDHQLRPDSAQDARLVQGTAGQYGVQFFLATEDVRSLR